MGTDGIFLAYPVTAVILCIYIFIYSRYITKKTNGKRFGLFMLEKEERAVKKCDITIDAKIDNIGTAIETLIRFLRETGMSEKEATFTGLAVEETIVYTLKLEEMEGQKHPRRAKKTSEMPIDILIRYIEESYEILFRSIGVPFDPSAFETKEKNENEEEFDNISMLHAIAQSISYENILGMNSTKIVIEKEQLV